jgi:hypothetical protein
MRRPHAPPCVQVLLPPPPPPQLRPPCFLLLLLLLLLPQPSASPAAPAVGLPAGGAAAIGDFFDDAIRSFSGNARLASVGDHAQRMRELSEGGSAEGELRCVNTGVLGRSFVPSAG